MGFTYKIFVLLGEATLLNVILEESLWIFRRFLWALNLMGLMHGL